MPSPICALYMYSLCQPCITVDMLLHSCRDCPFDRSTCLRSFYHWLMSYMEVKKDVKNCILISWYNCCRISTDLNLKQSEYSSTYMHSMLWTITYFKAVCDGVNTLNITQLFNAFIYIRMDLLNRCTHMLHKWADSAKNMHFHNSI